MESFAEVVVSVQDGGVVCIMELRFCVFLVVGPRIVPVFPFFCLATSSCCLVPLCVGLADVCAVFVAASKIACAVVVNGPIRMFVKVGLVVRPKAFGQLRPNGYFRGDEKMGNT